MKNKTDQKYKPPDTFDFPDSSAVSSIDRMGENEQDEEPYENFAPPLHSTAIYADEEFSQQCGSSVPSTLQRKEAGRSLNTSENEATESVKYHTKEKIHKKRKMSHGKRKKSGSKDVNSDNDLSDTAFIWCLEGKKTSDIMELDVVLSTFEKTFLEYKQRIESRVCKEAINKFYSNIKEELIKKIQEVQLLKNLKRRNVKMISDIEKKRQCLMEVQDELLRLEPQLKQLQIKYDELKERKSSFKNAAYFLHNLKELHQDYSDVQETKPEAKETYDSSSLPALLLKARGLLGAENHLQNISHQLEKLLGQE